MLNTNIRIINEEGSDFAYFTSKEDLYAKLSGEKDPYGEDMEFIEIGENIQLNDEILKVIDINLKFENIGLQIKPFDKTEGTTPKNLIIEVIITVKFIERI